VALAQDIRESVSPAPPRQRWGPAVLAASGLALVIFLFYFGPYPIRHARLPAGFDAPWYVWRARFVGAEGIGPLGTASRPGHAVLSALLGSVTGRSQLQLVVLFSQLLPVLLALAVGALAGAVTGRRRTMWVITALVAGATLGATRLVGENLANLVNVALEAGAILLFVSAASRRTALWGSVAMLVAAGLAHWVFLAVFEVMLGLAAGLTLIAARRADEPRSLEIRREARFLLAVGAWTAGIVAFLIAGVLRTHFRTFEIYQNPKEYAPKLITDVARLWPWGIAAALGLVVLLALRSEPLDAESTARRSFSGRVILAWAIVSAVGVLFGLATIALRRFELPPHRFLALLVAVPGMVAAGAVVWWGSRWVLHHVGGRGGSIAGLAAIGVVVASVALLAVPTVIRWYRYPILMRTGALRQAQTAGRYVAQLPKDQPFVFVIDGWGPAVVYDAPLRERVIRMALPPDRQEDLHLFVGKPSDLLAGRRTSFDPLVDRITAAYWRDVSKVLPEHPPVIVIQAMGNNEFREALAMGAPVIARGIVLLQGPRPAEAITEGPLPSGVPSAPMAVLWAVVLLAVLSAAGLGWTRAILGPDPALEVFVSLAPLVGAGMLLLAAFAATMLGVRMTGPGGVATYILVTVGGAAAASRQMHWAANRMAAPTG
jgi:hypothetical protein